MSCDKSASYQRYAICIGIHRIASQFIEQKGIWTVHVWKAIAILVFALLCFFLLSIVFYTSIIYTDQRLQMAN